MDLDLQSRGYVGVPPEVHHPPDAPRLQGGEHILLGQRLSHWLLLIWLIIAVRQPKEMIVHHYYHQR